MKDNILSGGILYIFEDSDSLNYYDMNTELDIVEEGCDTYQEIWIKAIQEDEEVFYKNGEHGKSHFEHFDIRLPEVFKEYGQELRITFEGCYSNSEDYRGVIYESIRILVVKIILSRDDEEDDTKKRVEDLFKYLHSMALYIKGNYYG